MYKYNVNDAVMYGTVGICRITAIETRRLTGKEMEYYILRQINTDRNIFYVPTNNEKALSFIRPVCSKADVDALIAHMNEAEPIWIANDIKRKEEYSRIIRDGNKPELIRLIKALYLHRRELQETGRKFRASDENYLKLAENMLLDEFAYALGIDRSEVVDYIEKHIA